MGQNSRKNEDMSRQPHTAVRSDTRPAGTPGKRTRTVGRAARSAGAAPPVQRERDPAREVEQANLAAQTTRWMNVVVRPDLHTAPVQRAADGQSTVRELPEDGAGKALPEDVQAKMEQAFGADFAAVRIHEGRRSQALGARAYTQGTDVHFAPGQYQPHSHGGQELLGHELAHVVQQSQGRVQTTMQAKGVAVNDDTALEAEADMMGARAARGEPVGATAAGNRPVATGGAAVVQRVVDVFSREAYADPVGYLQREFAGDRIVEDGGSGGIMDEPMRQLVRNLADPTWRGRFKKQWDIYLERLWNDPALSNEEKESRTARVPDSAAMDEMQSIANEEDAYQWAKQRTLWLTNHMPRLLTIRHEEGAGGAPKHTFHRDHGYVAIAPEQLETQGIPTDEAQLRAYRLNGPFERGWVRGHSAIDNMKHRFIEHIHVDKDADEDRRIDIYNADDRGVGETAEAWSEVLASTEGLAMQPTSKKKASPRQKHKGRQESAVADAEEQAKEQAFLEFMASLDGDDVDENGD